MTLPCFSRFPPTRASFKSQFKDHWTKITMNKLSLWLETTYSNLYLSKVGGLLCARINWMTTTHLLILLSSTEGRPEASESTFLQLIWFLGKYIARSLQYFLRKCGMMFMLGVARLDQVTTASYSNYILPSTPTATFCSQTNKNHYGVSQKYSTLEQISSSPSSWPCGSFRWRDLRNWTWNFKTARKVRKWTPSIYNRTITREGVTYHRQTQEDQSHGNFHFRWGSVLAHQRCRSNVSTNREIWKPHRCIMYESRIFELARQTRYVMPEIQTFLSDLW